MRMRTDDRRNWHLEKSVSVTHLMSTITFAAAAVWYIIGMDKRLELQAAQLAHQNEQIKQVQIVLGEGGAPLRRDIDRIQSDIRIMNDKLDRLIIGGIKK